MSRYAALRPARPPAEATEPPAAAEGPPLAKLVAGGGPARFLRAPVPADARTVTWAPPVQPAAPRFLKVALVGAPNAGKSSLVNQLLAARVAAVSKKVNTTRETLRGVLTDGDAQVVFLDGPGIVPSHGKKFAEELAARAWDGSRERDSDTASSCMILGLTQR